MKETVMRQHPYAALFTVCVVVLLALAMIGCAGGMSTSGSTGTPSGGTTAGGGTTVVEKGFAFEPATLEVKVGDTVTFTNEDSAPHNVNIDSKDLGNQPRGASVTWAAAKAGSFPYTCTIHPSMAGEIVVK
jgi:plastocyanin